MTTPNGGDAIPVTVSTDAPKGLSAIPAYVYTVATLPADIDIEGGEAQPIYLVSAAQLATGEYALIGDAAPVRLVTGTGRPAIGDVAPIPVYVAGGTLNDEPVIASPSVAAINTTYANDLSSDGLSWASARGAYVRDDQNNLLIYVQRYNSSSQRHGWIVSSDAGTTWIDEEGVVGGEGFLIRGSFTYDAANDCLHMLAVGGDPSDGAIYRRYTLTRDGSGAITAIARVASVQLGFGGVAYEMPILLMPTADRLVAVWTVRAAAAGQILACGVDISGDVDAGATATNWEAIAGAGAVAAGLTSPVTSVSVIASAASSLMLYYAVKMLASGALGWCYHPDASPGTWYWRRDAAAGSGEWTPGTPVVITNQQRAGTDSGYSLKDQLVSQLSEDGAGAVYVGLATWKNDTDGDTWSVWGISPADDVSGPTDVYSAGGAHSYAPTGDCVYDATADRLVVTWIVSGNDAEFAQMQLYTTALAEAGDSVELDGTHPCDIPLILDTRVTASRILFAFRQNGSPPQPGYVGTILWE